MVTVLKALSHVEIRSHKSEYLRTVRVHPCCLFHLDVQYSTIVPNARLHVQCTLATADGTRSRGCPGIHTCPYLGRPDNRGSSVLAFQLRTGVTHFLLSCHLELQSSHHS